EECYYAWSERGNPQTCTKSSDCDTKGAICVYSVMNQQHICCQNKENAILPKCPIGEIITNLSLLLCNPGNHVENDQCPQGSECLKSETNFTQNAEQPNYICCKI
ncbi:unnamed protein product, partial [Dracunculus medinensis]|uniref:CC domain-containing protein n=1 Tax=Dracunculus medinensis TaxID=318479 RepID=A0A0N4UDF4_DRAME